MTIDAFEIILYVENQQAAKAFYERLLQRPPTLNVEGMTEFFVTSHVILGLMPNNGIAKILADITPHPDNGTGIPRCELYLRVKDLNTAYSHAIETGAKLISPIQDRDWGDRVAYFADSDGHIIALAQKI
jgi:uncharacterized glyoxalase superfamily protein PhnB